MKAKIAWFDSFGDIIERDEHDPNVRIIIPIDARSFKIEWLSD